MDRIQMSECRPQTAGVLAVPVTLSPIEITDFIIFAATSNTIDSHNYKMRVVFLFLLFFKEFYLFLERRGGREKGRETLIAWLSHAPNWGSGPQPRHVPWLGIKLVTFCSMGQCPTHQATLVRTNSRWFLDLPLDPT